jgi:hypothetical protein
MMMRKRKRMTKTSAASDYSDFDNDKYLPIALLQCTPTTATA